jgi:protein ImuA
MQLLKTNIIDALQHEILLLQGFKLVGTNTVNKIGIEKIEKNFPKSCFPIAAIHEFICRDIETAAATSGFITGILSRLMRNEGISIWIHSNRNIFPPGLKTFGIDPDKIIFINLKNAKEILWTIEECLKCGGLKAVIGEIKDISFIASRRLQLAIEQSGVAAFLLRESIHPIVSASRWQIKHLPSELEQDLPGVGYSRWNVELLKARNGNPGQWQIEWADGKFRLIPLNEEFIHREKRKTG